MNLNQLSSEYLTEVTSMLSDRVIFALSLDNLHPATVPGKHTFDLTDDSSIYSRSRRLAPQRNELIDKEIEKILVAGIITPSQYTWSFPIFIGGKKDVSVRFFC